MDAPSRATMSDPMFHASPVRTLNPAQIDAPAIAIRTRLRRSA
jgi:hypothetical protein